MINVCVPNFSPYDSYGIKARSLVRWLAGQEQAYQVFSASGDSPTQRVQVAFGGIFFGYPTLINGAFTDDAGHTHPIYPPTARMGRRTLVTTFESEHLPDKWVEIMNTLDTVVVGASWVKRVFVREGVSVPIHVVPLGINPVFHDIAYRPFPPTPERPMKFLAFGDRGRRKGWLEAVRAFNAVVGDDMRYQLTIKSRNFPAPFTNPNIHVIERDMSDHELAALYREHHVMLFPGREGFGLPPREFAATGGVSVALNWGGTADNIHLWGVGVPSDGYETYTCPRSGIEWKWGSIDLNALEGAVRDVIENYPLYHQRALQFAPKVKALYDWNRFAESVWSIHNGNSYNR